MAVSIKHIPTEILVLILKHVDFTHIAENCSQVCRQWQGICCQFFIIPYILLMEKVPDGAMMHMWRLVLSSEPDSGETGHGGTGNGDSDSSGSVTPDAEHPGDHEHG